MAKVDQASRELRVADAIQHFTENGAVAQLGERELCKLEVIGSIPFASTMICAGSEHHPSLLRGSRDDRVLFDIVKREPCDDASCHTESVLNSDRS